MNQKLERRRFLRGIAWGAPALVGLPVLDIMLNENGTAMADESGLPLRLGVWYWGSGVHKTRFFPTETGTAWQITSQLAPLSSVRDHINVLSGYDIKASGIVHHVGTAVMKTGANYIKHAGQFDTDVVKESFDVTAARTLCEGLPFERLDLGVYSDGVFNGEGLNTRALSHNGPNLPNYAETNPQAIFDRLFGTEIEVVGVHELARQSVLDAVAGDIHDLMPRLGAADRVKVEQHLEAIRAIERRLSNTEGSGCGAPTRPEVGQPDQNNPDLVRNNELLVDLLSVALSCDLTRVFTFRHHGWTDDPVFREFDANARHHSLTHNEGGSQPTVDQTIQFTMGQFATLLQRLSETPEGDGSLLDRCAIMAYSEVAEGNNHSREDIPVIVAGRAGGALQTGLHHRGPGDSATKVNLTVARAVGLQWENFGEDENFVDSTITEIEV